MSVVTETAGTGAIEGEGTTDEVVDTGTEGDAAVVEPTGDYLSASDEAIQNANTPEEYAAAMAKLGHGPKSDAPVVDSAAEEDEGPAEGADVVVKEGDKPDADPESAAEGKDKSVEKAEKPETTDKDKDTATEDQSKVVVDFEAEYKRLLAPFKANGHEIQVKSVEDAIGLMQQGANYNKKMAALKPGLKLLKMLESNGFMSEEKVGFLLDLGKKDPAAINKLIKESGIDPMELDAEKASGYKQTTFAPTDGEMNLDTVLDEIKDSPTYTQVLNVAGKEWDAASRDQIVKQPAILKVISDHMQRGIYDRISKEVVNERLFGRLSGLTDIEAYRQVGDAMDARGEFKSPVAKEDKPAKEPVVVTPAPKKVVADELKDKRRAASSTKPVATAAVTEEFNPLNMSDEEFTKIANAKYK